GNPECLHTLDRGVVEHVGDADVPDGLLRFLLRLAALIVARPIERAGVSSWAGRPVKPLTLREGDQTGEGASDPGGSPGRGRQRSRGNALAVLLDGGENLVTDLVSRCTEGVGEEGDGLIRRRGQFGGIDEDPVAEAGRSQRAV